MLKLRTYFYSKSGEFLSSKQLSKASWFRLKNKAFEIDLIEAFPPKLKVAEKLEYVEYFKKELNSQFFQTEENSLFELFDDWHYITFDNKGNELFKEVNSKSKYFSIFKNYELKISDTFPNRLNPKQKLAYLEQIVSDLILEEEESKKLISEQFYTERRYYSKILASGATSMNMVIRFPRNPVWTIFKEELIELIKEHSVKARDELLKYKIPNKRFLWQAVALIVPVDLEGGLTHDHKQFISSMQTPVFKTSYEDMISKIDMLEDIFKENYELDFENSELGFREFTICLIQ